MTRAFDQKPTQLRERACHCQEQQSRSGNKFNDLFNHFEDDSSNEKPNPQMIIFDPTHNIHAGAYNENAGSLEVRYFVTILEDQSNEEE